MKIDSSNLRSWDGHLANTEKLFTLIGWSKLKACSLMLLKGGFEKDMLVLGDIPLCSQILLKISHWVSPIYVDWHWLQEYL